MISDRELLEQELKALVEVSSDFARGLSTVASRMKTIKSQLNKSSQPASTSRSVATIDRATSPITFHVTRSTSISPLHFEPVIKREKEDDVNDDEYNRGYSEIIGEKIDDTYSCGVKQSQNDSSDLNVLVGSHAANNFKVRNASLNNSSRKKVYIIRTIDDASTLSSNTIKPIIKQVNIPSSAVNLEMSRNNDVEEHVDEDLLYAERMNKSEMTLLDKQASKVLKPTNDKLSLLKKGKIVKNFRFSTPIRAQRTVQEMREYNRIRQALYRARMRKTEEVRMRTNSAHVLQNDSACNTSSKLITLNKNQERRTYGRKSQGT